jgi:hypothetical protein
MIQIVKNNLLGNNPTCGDPGTFLSDKTALAPSEYYNNERVIMLLGRSIDCPSGGVPWRA